MYEFKFTDKNLPVLFLSVDSKATYCTENPGTRWANAL